MSQNQELNQNIANYRARLSLLGRKEFTLMKMQEYGFWPKNLPTPFEKQHNETPEEYAHRKGVLKEYKKIAEDISKLYTKREEINKKLRELKKQYDHTWDYDRIRLDIAQKIMQESIARRAERKKQKALEKQQRHEAWQKKKSEETVFIGKGYSGQLHDKEGNDTRLSSQGLPIIKTDTGLAQFLGIEYKKLRFLTYHRDVVTADHYHRYAIPKKKGGLRNIAAPKPVLKTAQRRILEEILCKIPTSHHAHGFIKEKSVVSSAKVHIKKPELLINMDLEDFFPTITFERVRGMFKSFGYSGYIASLLAMICTYCESMKIEIKGRMKYVKTSDRILPQGSPASPMITNILCSKLDKRLGGLAAKFGLIYTRYADDMSFSIQSAANFDEGKFCGLVSKIISEEGFKINKSKTRFLRKNNRQCITGVIINNEELGIPRKWIKKLRAAIYNANKLKQSGDIPLEVIHEISGMTAWVKSVNAGRYENLIASAAEIIQYGTDLRISLAKQKPAPEPVSPPPDTDTTILKRGQRFSVKDMLNDVIHMRLEYGNAAEPLDIDPYVFLLHQNGKVVCDQNFVFFGNPVSKCGSVRLTDANGDKFITIEFGKLPESVETVSIAYSVYEADINHNFSKVVNPTVRITSEGKKDLHFVLDNLLSEPTVITMEFYRYNGEWKVNPIGSGYYDGVKHLCESYGLEVV